MQRALATMMVAGTIVAGSVSARQSDQAEIDLAAAERTALFDLREAIRQYEVILSRPGTGRAVAARAMLRMAEAHERLGHADARRLYQRVIQEYEDQHEAVALARARLMLVAQEPAQGLMRLPLTRGGDYGFGAITPDGRYLLSAGGIRDRVTGVDRERVDDGDCHLYPVVFDLAISPDGRQVAYACEDGSNPEFGSYELRTVAIDGAAGAAPRVLLRSPEVIYIVPFGWSPDDREVFALLTRRDGTHEIAAIADAGGRVRLIASLDWRWPEKLSLSPDGRYIAYDAPPERDSLDRHIFVLATDGSTHSPVVARATRDVRPVWVPDGSGVVFVGEVSTTPGLWFVAVENGGVAGMPRRLRLLSGAIRPLGFTAEGAFYYRSEDLYGSGGIHAGEIDVASGATVRPLARAIERRSDRSFAPAYAPDGSSLAFFTRNARSGFVSIVVRTLSSGAEREIPTALLVSPASEPFRADWLPDGSLVFVARTNEGENYSLQRVDLHTGRRLLDNRIEALQVSPVRVGGEGKEIYYTRRVTRFEQALLAYDVVDGRERELLRTPARLRSMAPSTDGRDVAFTLGDRWTDGSAEHVGLYVMPAAGGPARPLQIPSGAAVMWAVRWSPTGDAVLLQTGRGELWWSPLDGGAPRRVGAGTFPRVESLHPDGRQIANTQGDAREPPEVWVDFDLLKPLQPAAPASGRGVGGG